MEIMMVVLLLCCTLAFTVLVVQGQIESGMYMVCLILYTYRYLISPSFLHVNTPHINYYILRLVHILLLARLIQFN